MNERVKVQTSTYPAKPDAGRGAEKPVEKDRGIKSIGRYLTSTREQRNYGQTELARELNLAPSIIDALEKGDRSRLPEMTYVRGYLRSYARLLGIEDEINKRIIEELPNEWPDSETSTLSRLTVSTGEEFGGDERRGGRWWMLLLIPVLLIGGLYWLYANYNDEISGWLGTDSASETTTIIATGSGGDSDVIAVVEERVEEETVDPVQQAADSIIGVTEPSAEAETLVIEEAPTVIAASEEAPSITDATVPEPLDNGDPDEAAADDAASTDETAPETIAVSDENLSAAGDTTALVIEADKDSWIEVASATDDRLVHRLVRRGERLELSGPAPFRLLVGDASGVNVRYRGQSLDYQRFARGNVARFIIDDNGGGSFTLEANNP